MRRLIGLRHTIVVALAISTAITFMPFMKADEASSSKPAYRPLVAPRIPVTKTSSSNPIDAFWQASLDKAKVTPFPLADRKTLVRRLYMDVTGLPPTLEQTREFIEDPSTDAHEKLVHKLLQSPHYGEHWAQQWLDLVRYSDSEGFKIDRIRPEAWKYRNWVIRSLNEDMPYNQFVQWQIAGDELAPEVRDARIATGFLRLAPEESNGADYTLIRQDILNDVTDVTSQAVLGITMGCARCHHHKFDPIRQEEYFQFQAFFSGILYPDSISLPMPQSMTMAAKTVEEKARPIREEISQMMKGHEKDLFEEIVVALDPETQVALKTTPENRTVTQTQLAILASKQIERRRTKLYRRLNTEQRAVYDKKMENLKSIEKEKPSVEVYMGVEEKFAKPPATHRLAQGNARKPREEVQPGFPAWIDRSKPEISVGATTSGRRATLAKWITRDDHPLTSRVIVNRIWQGYFGHGLVENPSDFGKASEPYHQPELLDWLAGELVRNQWSLKSIHRLILNSTPYKLASKTQDRELVRKNKQVDPDNHLFWHAEVRRLSAEQVRDGILQASGTLNSGMHEGVVRYALPASMADSRYSWTPDEDRAGFSRRSIYLIQRRNLPNPALEAFDFPDRNLSCAMRSDTVTPLQALALLNDPAMLEHSQALAANVLLKSGSATRAQIENGFLSVLRRSPDAVELEQSRLFLEDKSNGNDRLERLTDLLHALLNTSEFLELE